MSVSQGFLISIRYFGGVFSFLFLKPLNCQAPLREVDFPIDWKFKVQRLIFILQQIFSFQNMTVLLSKQASNFFLIKYFYFDNFYPCNTYFLTGNFIHVKVCIIVSFPKE